MEKFNNNIVERTLSEQYSENNNERMTALVSLFVSLFAVIGVFGLMYAKTTLRTACDFGDFCDSQGQYSIEILLFVASACFLIIWVMQRLCIYQGSHQRFEQFVVHAIRYKHLFDNTLLYSEYNPFGKNRIDFIQGVWLEFLKILFVFFCIILLSTLLKLFQKEIVWSVVTYWAFGILILTCLLIFIDLICFTRKKYCFYNGLCEVYKETTVYTYKTVKTN